VVELTKTGQSGKDPYIANTVIPESFTKLRKSLLVVILDENSATS
jgi:hypothetical protein